MSVQPVLVSFDDFMTLSKDSADLKAVKAVMATKFPDDTCQVIALKGILGIEIEEEKPDTPDEPDSGEPTDPVDPGTSDPSDPTDPSDPSGSSTP